MARTGSGDGNARIWLDLATPPQVLFFRPIARTLEERGVQLSVTVRDFGATVALAEKHDYGATAVGGTTGKGIARKLTRTVGRAVHLGRWAMGRQFDLALGYNSYAQAVAARALRVRLVTSMDFEHQPANRLCFAMAHRIIVPEGFDIATIVSARVRDRVRRHAGLKEHVYLADWPIDVARARAAVGLPSDAPYVIVRSPADYALYHRFENELFYHLVATLARIEAVTVLVMPRTHQQASELTARFTHFPTVTVSRAPVDGPSLIAGAAAVVSAGGTMAREATVLGTPAFTIFGGQQPGVDSWLIDSGRLRKLSSQTDVETVEWDRLFTAPPSSRRMWIVPEARETFLEHVLGAL